MTQKTHISAEEWRTVDRREHHHLRSLYPDVSIHVAHSFEYKPDWVSSPIDYLACRLLHETYPELTSKEVVMLVGAIKRQTVKEYSHA